MIAKLRNLLAALAAPAPEPNLGPALGELFAEHERVPMLTVARALDGYVHIGHGLAEKLNPNMIAAVRELLSLGIEPTTRLEALALCAGRGESILSRFLYEPEVKRDDLERALEDESECRAEIAAILLWDTGRLTCAEKLVADYPQDCDDATRVQATADKIDRTTRAETYRFEMLARIPR